MPEPLRVRDLELRFGERTYVMGIVNVTPDSFSGDGLLGTADATAAAVDRAVSMASDGADLLDIGASGSVSRRAPPSSSQPCCHGSSADRHWPSKRRTTS